VKTQAEKGVVKISGMKKKWRPKSVPGVLEKQK
jgi:hypothetical protein